MNVRLFLVACGAITIPLAAACDPTDRGGGTEIGNPRPVTFSLRSISAVTTDVGLGDTSARFRLDRALVRFVTLRYWTADRCEALGDAPTGEVELKSGSQRRWVNLVTERTKRFTAALPPGPLCRLQVVATPSDQVPSTRLDFSGDLHGAVEVDQEAVFELVSSSDDPIVTIQNNSEEEIEIAIDPGIWLAAALDAQPVAARPASVEAAALGDGMWLFVDDEGAGIEEARASSPRERAKTLASSEPSAHPLADAADSPTHFWDSRLRWNLHDQLLSRPPEDRIVVRPPSATQGTVYELNDARRSLTVRLTLDQPVDDGVDVAAAVATQAPLSLSRRATLQLRDLRSGRRWTSSTLGCTLQLDRFRVSSSTDDQPPTTVVDGSGDCLGHLRGRLLPGDRNSDGVVELPERFYFRLPVP